MTNRTITVNGVEYGIPTWFTDRELSRKEAMAVYNSGDGWEARRETERAVLMANRTDWGTVKLWIPKSILIGPEEMAESARRAAERRAVNDAYYAYLRQTAKENGVKLGSVRKWDKIRARLAEAGVAYMGRDEFAAQLA